MLCDALNHGFFEHLTGVDVRITEEVRSLAGLLRCDPSRFTLVEESSLAALPGLEYDFLILDGDHTCEHVMKEAAIIEAARPQVVCAHDTTAGLAGYPQCEGPAYLKHRLQTGDYYCLEDNLKRPGERTERGFLFATTDASLHGLAQPVFRHWMTCHPVVPE